MKFLCVPCDTPMTLRTVAPPDKGSLSVVYTCPDCGYEIAMLTNAYETQVVQSLGVRIGPARAIDTHGEAVRAAEPSGRCPFAAMVPAAESAADGAATPAKPADAAIRWTSAAEARLSNIPEFVRPMARIGIEKFAVERGAPQVDEAVLDAARDYFGM
jgi:hypothetical protein